MNNGVPKPARSTFVTVLAWIFIVFAGFSSLVSLIQNIMVDLMFQTGEIEKGIQYSEEFQKMPLFFRLFSTHPKFFLRESWSFV